MIKSEKIFLAAFLVMGAMTILFMNIPPRNTEVINSESSVVLLPAVENIKKAITQSFTNGTTVALKTYLSDEISLSIEGTELEFNAAQTMQAMDKFFEDSPPKYFIIKHEGNNKTKTEKFWIGEYTSLDNVIFSVYVYMEKSKIYSIEISLEEMTSLTSNWSE